MHKDIFTLMKISRWVFLKWKPSQIKFVEKIKTHILCSVTFFSKIMPFMRSCEKYCRYKEATGSNRVYRMRCTYYITKATHTHIIFNNCCFFTAIIVKWTRLIITFKLTLSLLCYIRRPEDEQLDRSMSSSVVCKINTKC